ncbi:hypothetical protein [Paraliobacillus ryukyuensis]|uniref:hypothetical protein n=1 Tax=Paraliobacillus ryukyuensis TaxID=200904 RepID=UPI0015C4984B|nr:hypothetical protein [Paraliobacillus ryukyuensis]
MSYKDYVLNVFIEDQNAMGKSIDDIEQIIKVTKFERIEKWLTKMGYDLNEYYL